MDMSILRSDCLSKGRGTIKEYTISFRAVWQHWAPLYITLRMGTFTGWAWRGGNGELGMMHRAICQIPVMLAEIWLPEIIMEVSCLDSSAQNRERSWTVSCWICVVDDACPEALLLGWTSVLAPFRAFKNVLYLLSEVSSLKNRHSTGELRGVWFAKWTRSGDKPRKITTGTLSLKGEWDTGCHWKDRINWNLLWNLPSLNILQSCEWETVLRIPLLGFLMKTDFDLRRVLFGNCSL